MCVGARAMSHTNYNRNVFCGSPDVAMQILQGSNGWACLTLASTRGIIGIEERVISDEVGTRALATWFRDNINWLDSLSVPHPKGNEMPELVLLVGKKQGTPWQEQRDAIVMTIQEVDPTTTGQMRPFVDLVSIFDRMGQRYEVCELNAMANAKDCGRDQRCRAVFSLFRDYVKPGAGRSEMSHVVSASAWFNEVHVEKCTNGTQLIPSTLAPLGVSLFRLVLFPRCNDGNDWVIYIAFTDPNLTEADAVETINGRGGSSREQQNGRIVTIALQYPDGTVTIIGSTNDITGRVGK